MECWLSAHPSKCRGDSCCALPLSVKVVFFGERSYVFLVVFAQILSGGSLCGKSCVNNLVKILLCEGEDVEQWLETKHIFVFAIDPLSLNSLSYIVHCIILFISFICLDLVVCHTCVKPRELHIAPQLLLEKFRGDSPEPFTRNSAILFGYTKCVAISFDSALFVIRLAIHLFTPLYAYFQLVSEPTLLILGLTT